MNVFQWSILITFAKTNQHTIEEIVAITKLPFNAVIKGLKGFTDSQILTLAQVKFSIY